MTSNSPPNEPDVNLSEEEKARIRAEVRYAASVAKEAAKEALPPEQSKTILEKIVNNSAFYLILGSLLTTGTSFLSQKMQQNAENKKQQIELSRQLFQNFVLYSNTLWKELYAVEIPTREKLSEEQFFALKKKIHDIQLGRRDAYAKILVIANTIDDRNGSSQEQNTTAGKLSASQKQETTDDGNGSSQEQNTTAGKLSASQKQETTPEQVSNSFECNLDKENNKADNLQTAIENYSKKLEIKSQCIARWLDAFYCMDGSDSKTTCSAETMKIPDLAYEKMVESFKSVENEDRNSVLSMIGRKNNAQN